MSVKELKFTESINELFIKQLEGERLAVSVNGRTVVLARSEAHLFYLYLKERFGQ